MEISLTLNPAVLSNPDADLRYTIPEMIEKLSNREIIDDGYDYDDQENMVIYLSSETLSESKAIELIQAVCRELHLENEAIKIEFNV